MTRFHRQIQPLQNRLAAVVSKAHLLELQPPAQGWHRSGIGTIRPLHGFGLDRSQTSQGGLTLLELIEIGDQTRDRVDQDQQRRDEAAETCATQTAGADAQGTDQQHRQDARRFNETHHGVLQGQQSHRAVASTAMQLNFFFETLLQPGFSSESPHQRQA